MKRNLWLILVSGLILAGCGNDSANSDSGGTLCGNRVIDDGEACDDGNQADGDGCSADCAKIEAGYECPAAGEACVKKSAENDPNGQNDENDPNGQNDEKDPNGENGDNNPNGDSQRCGNGEIETGEACDDGNEADGDGCSADCKTIEDGYECPYEGYECVLVSCGNGVVDEGEDCDPGADYLADYGQGECSKSCHEAHYCGDGLWDQVDKDAGEECDNGPDNKPAASSDYDACSDECKRINYCGDGRINGDEKCDDGNTADGDGCSSKCEYEPGFSCTISAGKTTCSPINCGNGKVESDKGEGCDDGGRVSGDGCSSTCQVENGYQCQQVDESGKSICVKTCGNGEVEPDYGEKCDDGNTADGDGCSSTCQVEAGYYCEPSAQADESGHKPSVCKARACGDGFVAGDEECDDGNVKSNDGCSDRCKREPGYHCPASGGACEPDKCGDGIVTGDEKCDEGSAKTDGCVNCQIQKGWECLTPGQSCTQTAVCGDGKLQGSEECDEGGAKTDGCVDCVIANGWRCPDGPGKSCIQGKCGDKALDKGEQCDDGNLIAGDGCSPICEIEPIYECKGVTCKPTCGDGLTLKEAGEECDDGNLIAGDGCSPDCKIEKGFSCIAPGNESEWPSALDLPITYRDFIRYHGQAVDASTTPMPDGYVSKELYDSLPDHCKGLNNGYRQNYALEIGRPSPDFYSYCPDSKCTGNVKPMLGPDGKPELQDPTVPGSFYNTQPVNHDGNIYECNYLYTCPEVFKWWYADVKGINIRYDSTLHMEHLGNGTYQYSNSSFLPLANITDVNGATGYTAIAGNGEFTSEFHTYFKYNGGEVLKFNGDDDVWVFMNGRLAVDVGGIHPRWEREIRLDERAEELHMYKGGIYSLDMFHAERCLGGSSFKLTLSGFMQMGKSTCTTTCGDGIVAGAEQCDIEGHVDDETAHKAGCSNCQFKSYCGNGKVETGESCDTGDTAEDWCVNCQITTCGNNKLDTDHEQCDLVDGKYVFAGKTEAESVGLKCAQCHIVGCGDGIVDEGEECDDGNAVNDDTCSNACKKPICGDGIVQTWLGEVCDDKINDGTYGHCGMGCTYMAPKCGDGVVDKLNGEQCDDGVNSGLYGTCNPDCTLPSHCGDGILDEGFEECDDGDKNGLGGCTKSCSKIVN